MSYLDVHFVDVFEEQLSEEVALTEVYVEGTLVGQIYMNTEVPNQKYRYGEERFETLGDAKRWIQKQILLEG